MGRGVTVRVDKCIHVRGGPFMHTIPLRVGGCFLVVKTGLKDEDVATICSGVNVVHLPRRCGRCVRRFKVFTDAGSLRVYSYSCKSRVMLKFASGVPGSDVREGFRQVLNRRGISRERLGGRFPKCKRGRELRGGRGRGIVRAFDFLYLTVTMVYKVVGFVVTNMLG